MTVDRIEREITIAAPADRVWEVLTRPEHIERWFGDRATMDARPGGKASFGWRQHGEFHAVVERAEPPHVLTYRWAHPADEAPRPGNSTLVEFTLVPHGDQTLLTVVERGFATLDHSETERVRHARENLNGWDQELADLQRYIARTFDDRRR